LPSTAKDYQGEYSFKGSPNKIAKSIPDKTNTQVNEKENMGKKGEFRNEGKFEQADEKYGGKHYKEGDRQHKGSTGANSWKKSTQTRSYK
jgi:hypothetical protein